MTTPLETLVLEELAARPGVDCPDTEVTEDSKDAEDAEGTAENAEEVAAGRDNSERARARAVSKI